ncbi:HAMP domain-containing sensor histidine kinase [Allofournierella sp.]|uniref:HAMP domain-containing sensor histidine kinase n=1 Tax=Allofournierella sp. TaxID=1940256 RepID=UPI003AB5C043
MKIHNKWNGRLAFALLRGLMVFTLTIALTATALYAMYSRAVETLMNGLPGKDLLHYVPQLASGEYRRFPARKLLGRTGYIDITDTEGNVLYTSGAADKQKYSATALMCIPLYQKNAYVAVTQQQDKDGKPYTLVAQGSTSGEKDDDLQEIALLDEKHNVIYSGLPRNVTTLDEESYGYMTQTLPEGYLIWRLPFAAQDGQARMLILYEQIPGDAEYLRLNQMRLELIVVFFVLYAGIMLVLTFWLNRKINRPLEVLNSGLMTLADGRRSQPIDYRGPQEFEQICTSFNQLALRLAQSEERRRQLEEDRQKMLADISHDLKTPITVIQGYSKAVCDGLIPEEKLPKYLQTIYQKSNGLTALINTFYEYSKLEHPDFSLCPVQTDLCEFMREYLAARYSELELSGFCLEVDIPETPLLCMIDTPVFTRVLENLTANALRHNPSGTTMFFRASLWGQKARILVADDGVGIPPKLAQNIFEPFVVGDESRSSRQGSGLGLAVSRHIVEAHGGTIRLVIPPDAGYSTEFELLLPTVPAKQQ